MTVTDEELMALADGELDPARIEILQHEIETSPELARRVAEARALRDRLSRAFDPVLQEPVPLRLTNLITNHRLSDVHSAARARRRRGAWIGGLGLAAGVVLGIALGPELIPTLRPQPEVDATDTGIVAGGALADSLSHQLASEQSPSAPTQIGVTFTTQSGEYCRTFVSRGSSKSLVGLACRRGATWRIDAMEAVAVVPGESGSYRQAATSLPLLILRAAEDAMVGDPLNAEAEATARARDWRPPRAEK